MPTWTGLYAKPPRDDDDLCMYVTNRVNRMAADEEREKHLEKVQNCLHDALKKVWVLLGILSIILHYKSGIYTSHTRTRGLPQRLFII